MRLLLPNCLSVETNLQALHAAAVFALVAPGQTSAIMDASIKGAEVALRAAADARVRKVVMTSLTVTLPLTEEGAPPVDESHWTADLQVPYFHAKTKGERLAWQLAADLGLDLVTVLPAGTTGPGFARRRDGSGRPADVELSAAGVVSPLPTALTRMAVTPW